MHGTSSINCSPSCFDALLGNDLIKKYLYRVVELGKYSGSFLFTGPEGIGKSLFALQLAKKIFSLNDPKGLHQYKVAQGCHPDIHLYRPQGKTAMHTIDSIRQLSQEIPLTPHEAPRSIYIIHEADRMLPTSANALLKTFEEPAPHAIVILLSSVPEQILPTIRSRCRSVLFQPIQTEQIAAWLMQNQHVNLQEAQHIALLSNGSLSRALSLAAKGTLSLRKQLLDFLSQNHQPTYIDIRAFCKNLADQIDQLKEGENPSIPQTDFLFLTVLSWFRDLHLVLSSSDHSILMNLDYQEAITNTVQRGNLPSIEKVEKAISAAQLAVARFIPITSVLESLFLKI